MSVIYNFFGIIMKFIYNTLSFGNYGIAIIIFTIITKLALMPLSIKQIKASGNNAEMQKEVAEINKLFKGNREKIAEETEKIYKHYGFNPMSGCLPTLIQFPIIIALYAVVRKPIEYILSKDTQTIEKARVFFENKGLDGFRKQDYYELSIMNQLNNNPDYVKPDGGVTGFEVSDIINFNFLGVNLGMTPTVNFGIIGQDPLTYIPLLFIPILAAATTYVQTLVMNKVNKTRSAGADQAGAAGMMKGMSIMMPVMILIFAFQVPASLGLYWIIGNIFSIVQQIITGKIMENKRNRSDDRDKIIEVKGKRV